MCQKKTVLNLSNVRVSCMVLFGTILILEVAMAKKSELENDPLDFDSFLPFWAPREAESVRHRRESEEDAGDGEGDTDGGGGEGGESGGDKSGGGGDEGGSCPVCSSKSCSNTCPTGRPTCPPPPAPPSPPKPEPEVPQKDFKKNFQLCYEWKSTGDPKQCGGNDKTGDEVCSAINKFTEPYIDDTDQRKGGCQMRWKLKYDDGKEGSEIPDWLKYLGICFKWSHSTFHNSSDKKNPAHGQCGTGEPAGEDHCVVLNKWTEWYLDNTDHRKGGCNMQWKLYVPCDHPSYMTYAKMCYKSELYKTTTDAQCHQRGKDACANINVWTTLYVDDTDQGKGGCKLSWGVFDY